VIRSGVNGFVCSSADEFVATLRKILEEPAKYAKLAGKAREDILEKYNTRIMAEKYREIYEDAFRRSDKQDPVSPSRKKKKK